MNMRHELLGSKVELARKQKKSRIIADALAAHIIAMLSQQDYGDMDTEDLQLSAQSLSEAVTEMRALSERIARVNEALGE
ncbi:hypothetical protein [Desulfovibrio sp. SGI.169]|uniref:hypothetical protein n=1 Tax=Desulfovibrio sp. SGI.169 TaxID=3420561 RepID=UPI003D043BCC